LNRDLLRSFVEIADCRNLTAAVARLSRTQSAISVQRRKLEAELGTTLFYRRPKGMILTDAGDRLLPAARSVLAELNRARALFTMQMTGQLRIGIPDDFDEAMLEQALSLFSRRHPGVDLIATSGCTSGFDRAIRDGTLAIAVCSSSEGEMENVFLEEPTVWVAGKDAQLPDNGPISLAILDRACWWRDLPLQALKSASIPYTVSFKSGSFSNLKAAIRSGFAIGILPASSLCSEMRRLGLSEGFPSLPISHRMLRINPNAAPQLTSAMSRAIREACRQRAEAAQQLGMLTASPPSEVSL